MSSKYSQSYSATEHSSLNRYQIEQNDKNYKERYQSILNEHSHKILKYSDECIYSEFVYRKIASISIPHSQNITTEMREQLNRVFSAMWAIKIKFCLFVRFDGNYINFYVGSNCKSIDVVRHIYEGSVHGIVFENNNQNYSFNDIIDRDSRYLGMFSGNPVIKDYINGHFEYSTIDEIIMGTKGVNWSFSLYAEPINVDDTIKEYNQWLNECTESSENLNVNYSNDVGSGVGEHMSTTKVYSGVQSFNQYAVNKCNVLKEALQCGQWKVTAVCFARNNEELNLFGGLFSAQMKSGTESFERPLPFDFYSFGSLERHPGLYITGDKNSSFNLSSKELAALASLTQKDTFGLKISESVDFDVSSTQNGDFEIGRIIDGTRVTECKYKIDVNLLNRHGLIIGLTGGGKTNTVKSLIYSIHSANLPFMIIEPAKKEYFELYRMGFNNLQIYSVGQNKKNSLKINPFEFMEGISLQAHIDAVFSAFKASFIMYTPMPYVLENAIYEIYKDYGWDVETGENRYNERIFPTIEDLYYKIQTVVIDMGYDAKMQNDLIGSMKARINSLRMGAKGNVLNVARSISMPDLLKGEVIIELDDVGDEEAKAFIISIILMQLNECRKSDIISRKINNKNANLQLEVQHIVIIEEAHRLLKNISSGSGENADPRGAAVEYFCNMLAEIRSRGQGFLVVDQIPSKLAPDLIKNTNLKIIHRTVDVEDRTLVGGAMHMTENQIEYLSCLNQGEAAIYSEGDNRPKLVKLPYAKLYERGREAENLLREEILQRTEINCLAHTGGYKFANQMKINRICASCSNVFKCIHTSNYIVDMLAKHYDTTMLKQLISKVTSIKLEKDVYQWIIEEYKNKIAGRDINYTMRCMFAMWFSNCESKMKYTDKCNIIKNFTEHLKDKI